ncbi:hypothetical protein EIP91_007909 [Steccherinum ochraceum]|uniref:LsmAD domain-containing protein n=1 Tax=Steccherinum ochraceum TaxID=92696 RepID=A0A4R0RQ94_9APHY|nr:hypothetical protein EIP91_007909 [Steccherinum ochraceum]
MATTARQSKQPRKGMAEPAARRAPAWGGSRASPTFSPGVTAARLPNGPAPASPGSFPPLNQNGAARPQDRILQQLSGLTGTTVTLSTKTAQRYEGVIASTGGEGDTTGVTLKDVKELTAPGTPLKDTLFVASTNIDTWSSGPADAKAPNGTDSFKTDTDIGAKGAGKRERELQAWQPAAETPAEANPPSASSQILSAMNAGARNQDDLTFGPGASHGNQSWDQFDVNEKLFGVKASFDEEQYTTKLDRNAPDFKEKEKKAQQLANEILGSTANNSHIAEERVMNFTGDIGTNEEDKYGAVVRGAGAYVPPGARSKSNIPAPAAAAAAAAANANGVKADSPNVSVTVSGPDGSAVPVSTPSATSPAAKPPAEAAFRDFVTSEKDRLMKKKQAIMKSEMDKRMADLVKFSKSFKLNKPIPDDLVPILAKDEEKQRLIKEKSSKDAESTHARSIGPLATTATSSNSSSNNPSLSRLAAPAAPNSAKPPSAVPAIVKASVGDAKYSAGLASAGKSASAKADAAAAANKRISMVIQTIPPFKGKRASIAPSVSIPSTSGANGANGPNGVQARPNPNAVNSPLSPTSQNRLNVNASSFRPTTKPFSPQQSAAPSTNGSASPKPKTESPPQSQTPNPFFGVRTPKKGPPVHIKEDFNPFKFAKVAEASSVGPNWSYSGKRYMTIFPPSPPVQQPQQQSPHMAPPPPPVAVPPPQFTPDEDQNAQAQAQAQAQAPRGYMYYPQYGYPQPMMPGMGPPPPGAYMPGPFMQPVPYPMPPPNGKAPQYQTWSPSSSLIYVPSPAMYANAPMGQMPPQAYMHPPPGTYPPPPNGAGPRPSMPPTPVPSHAHPHPYYQQSPHMQHAVPYQMMMPPPGAPGGPPHPYEGGQAPVPMGGHA